MSEPVQVIEALSRFSGRRALVIDSERIAYLSIIARRFDHVDVLGSALPNPAPVASVLPQNVSLMTRQGEDVPFKDGSYDVVFLIHVLAARSEWKSVLTDTLRVLRNRGQLVVLDSSPRAATERQRTHLDLEQLLRDRDAALRGQRGAVISPEDLRRDLRSLEVHHLRFVDIPALDLPADAQSRAEFKKQCLERIKRDLIPTLGQLGSRRDEFEQRLIDLKRRIEVTGVEPHGFILAHGIKKSTYASVETPLFAAETLAPPSPLAPASELELSSVSEFPQGTFPVDEMPASDLLALVLAGGESGHRFERLAKRILRDYGSRAIVDEKDPKSLAKNFGISETRARQLIAIFELGRRFFAKTDADAPVLRGPEDVFRYAADMAKLDREQFRGLYLNSRQRLVVEEVISIGTLTNALLHPREVFRPAVVHRAVSVILVHNHPSGDPEPSTEDVEMTRQVQQAGRILGIELMDHVIIGGDQWFSMKQSALI